MSYKQLLSENEYREHREKYGNTFKAGMGAEAIKRSEKIDLEKMSKELKIKLKESSGQKKVPSGEKIRSCGGI